MKRFISILLTVMIGLTTASACVKKKQNDAVQMPLTVLVTDTTQALLADAELKAGKTVLRTRFDGRIVLTPEQLKGVKSLSVSCKGYMPAKVSLSSLSDNSNQPLIIALTPKPGTAKDEEITAGGVILGGKRERMPAMPMVKTADGVATEAYAMMDMASTGVRPRHGGATPNAAAGMLTAGEVNDFAKWSFWPTILDSTHSAFISHWRLCPRHRHTVQVIDKHGYPIVNYPVNLTDTKGNTVFQAMTDNTGKAELWNGLTADSVQVNQPAWQNIVSDESCAHSDDVDVVFVFDATGSMGDELRYLQAEMKDVIARAENATGGLHIRTGAVVYRDHSDEYLTRLSRLSDDIATTQTFIDKQQAGGGGDYEEAVPEALMAAINSAGWNAESRARIAFLILDAPCHNDSATLALLHEQVLNAAAQGIRIVPVVCSGLSESGEYLMRSIALATNGTSFFLTDDSGIGHTHLKPTTDSLKVEHLNDMLVRTIVEFSYMPDCVRGKWHYEEIENIPEAFIPNPFESSDLTDEERLARDSRTTLYLVDISGKLIYVYQGNLEDASDSQLSRLRIPMLSTGVYLVKAFYDGVWHTKKILVH